ncbi:MAG: hypothetical protein L0226_11105 [Acidobacteria bacterium]|nr:hypothetical protein [Acidobacteriota bacterium]
MNRRSFLSSVSCSLVTIATPIPKLFEDYRTTISTNQSCWLDVCAPFIIEDADRGFQSEIILTSDTFVGARGYEDGADATDYEIYLYDLAGKAIGAGGPAKRMTVPAMRATVISARELIGDVRSFWGGMNIRLRPKCREVMHASDLFSSAFLRWRSGASFDNVHANPDPLQLQKAESYFYSMPFPSLADYDCIFSLFNPYGQRSAGEILLNDPSGKPFTKFHYDLKPHNSLLLDLNSGRFMSDPLGADSKKTTARMLPHGLLAVTNEQGTAKSFGYLMIRQRGRERFSVEHPIHQGVFKPKPVAAPFDAGNQFKAKNVLYSPLLFHNKKIGGLTFESRFYFGAGLPLEEAQWFYPFAVDGEGNAVWSAITDQKLADWLPGQTQRGVIRLSAGQSCMLDFNKLSLDSIFAGGLAVAVSPDTTHTLLKVEVRVPEWGAHAFTHFRPGLRSARTYQKTKERGGIATDYIASGARISKSKSGLQFDELIGVMNIDDQGIVARPLLELFGPRGLIGRLPLGAIPPFACRHFLLSELIKEEVNYDLMSLRLLDERATLLMSVMHLDYTRQDIALDHGSDRFSTYLDYGCQI